MMSSAWLYQAAEVLANFGSCFKIKLTVDSSNLHLEGHQIEKLINNDFYHYLYLIFVKLSFNIHSRLEHTTDEGLKKKG